MKRSSLKRLFQGSNSRAAKLSQRRNRHELLESRACLAASAITNDWTDLALVDSFAESHDPLAIESIVADHAAIDDEAVDGAAEQVDQIIESLPDDLLDDIENNTAPQIDDALSDDIVLDDGSSFDDDADEALGDESTEGDEQETEGDVTGLAIASDDGLGWRGEASEVMGDGVGGTDDGNLAASENAVDGSSPTFVVPLTDEEHAGIDYTKGDHESSRHGSAHNPSGSAVGKRADFADARHTVINARRS
jgi:hypothetical protein